MTEQIRENYFLTVKTFFVLFIEIYLLLIRQAQAGISGGIFLLMALFFGLFIGQALTEKKGFRMFFLLVATGELVLLVFWYGKMFLLPGVLLGYEIVSALRHWRKEHGSVLWYALPLLFTVPFCAGNSNWYFVIALFVGIIYLQHDFIVTSYRVQMRENTISEQHLKKDLNEREHALHEELKRGLLGAENQVLEERANLSQMLHDKLGHSINGSVYQLEAAKHLIGVRVFSLGLGGSKKTSPELQASMEEALLAVQERFLCGSGILLENIEHTPVLYEQRLLDKYTRRIGHALEILNIEEMKQAVHELFQAAVDTPNVHGFELFELVCAAGNIFVMQLDVKEKEKLMKNLKENCDAASNAEELFQKLEQFEEAQILEILKVREADSARPVRKAKCYIKNHYGEQITLEEVSAEVGLSTAYFSVLFKKETEVGFAKYLDALDLLESGCSAAEVKVRMEQAKTLLRETNLPVAGICKKVGYNDLKHFTHTFEKLAGVKPAVYRKLYG